MMMELLEELQMQSLKEFQVESLQELLMGSLEEFQGFHWEFLAPCNGKIANEIVLPQIAFKLLNMSYTERYQNPKIMIMQPDI